MVEEGDGIPAAFKPRTLITSGDSLREAASLKLPQLLKERPLDAGHVNKVFASRWFDDRHLAFGTKCNGLYVLDLAHTRSFTKPSITRIPNLVSPNTHFR